MTSRIIWLNRIAALAALGLAVAQPVLGVSLISAWCIYVGAAAYYYQQYLGRVLQRDLGFCLGQDSANGSMWRTAIALRTVAEGGVFDRAGFSAGDVLPDVSLTDLFRLLHQHRGRMLELAVVDGGDGPPFCERARRILRCTVPTANEDHPAIQ